MRTFSIQTLGCKVNQYESDQIATVLRAHGLTQDEAGNSDLQIINTCSVTTHAAKDSRGLTRKAVKLGRKTIVTGCWATSDKSVAEELGADAVLTHHDNVAERLSELLQVWATDKSSTADDGEKIDVLQGAELIADPNPANDDSLSPRERAGVRGRAESDDAASEGSSSASAFLGELQLSPHHAPSPQPSPGGRGSRKEKIGTHQLPLLNNRQSGHQRAFLKIQDGCDAHCTYCIIPQLRPSLWSKPIDDVVQEAKQLVDAGHHELILTGIFLGAYNQPTALRRRQSIESIKPIAKLIDALCTRVPNLRRLRLSSLEPGDLNSDLIAILKSHPQLVPHFHLPLQSGSDFLLHRMNRQYTRDDFLRMVDEVHTAFDRPALTTDIIVGFPGETDDEFARTLEVVNAAKFIHTHAFSFSPRPGTAAARWTKDFVRGPIVNQRIAILNDRARKFSEDYRQQFVGETVEVLVEHSDDPSSTIKHGRCERYFDVHFESDEHHAGDAVKLRIDRVTPTRTFGIPVRRRLPVLA